MFAAPPSNNTVIYVKDLRLVEEDIFTVSLYPYSSIFCFLKFPLLDVVELRSDPIRKSPSLHKTTAKEASLLYVFTTNNIGIR